MCQPHTESGQRRMRWMQHSYSTLAPRVGHIFWALHGLMVLGLAPWMAFSWSRIRVSSSAWTVLLVYSVLLVAVFVYARASTVR